MHIVTQLECFVLGEEANLYFSIKVSTDRLDHFVSHVIEETAVTAV